MNFDENYMDKFSNIVHIFEKKHQLCTDNQLNQENFTESELEWERLENTWQSCNALRTISYEEAVQYFKELGLSEYKDKITTVAKRRKISVYLYCLQPVELKPEHRDDYNLVFLISKCPYDSNDTTHVLILRSIYRFMVSETNVDFNWENIGFQSDSPWSDLRGVGMLGAVQMLYLCSCLPALMEYLYKSLENKCNSFPFAVVSLNMTRITLNMLRRGKLNRDINKTGVFEVANQFYSIIFYAFGNTWINKKKTISDVDTMFKDIEKLSGVKRSRKEMLKSLERFLRCSDSQKNVCDD